MYKKLLLVPLVLGFVFVGASVALADDPTIDIVSPPDGTEVELYSFESFVWTVDANHDGALTELEVDHSLEGTIPEFTVYADEVDPYGGDKAAFDAAGVTVNYDEAEQKWVIDFGLAITHTNFVPGGITFYIEVNSDDGGQFGDMFDVQPEYTFDYTFDVIPYPVSGEIIEPEENEIVTGVTDLVATYDDGEDADDDAVNWAVREGTCDVNAAATVAGNVAGFSTLYDWDGSDFSSEWDTTGATPGMYCFIFNPTDDEGQEDVRETREFYVAESYVNGGGHILKEDDSEDKPKRRKSQLDISFGGWIADVGELMGEWNIVFHNVADGMDLEDKDHFVTTEITNLTMFEGDTDACVSAMNFTAEGELNGEEGYTLTFRGGDSEEPASDSTDTVRITLEGSEVTFDTYVNAGGSYLGSENCVGSARTYLDKGNLTILDNN